MSIQAILLLLIFPDGTLKRYAYVCLALRCMIIDLWCYRWMLRIYFGVLGIVVTTGGEVKSPKVDILYWCVCVCIWVVDSRYWLQIYIANRLSFIDHIVLHIAMQCNTVSSSVVPKNIPVLYSLHVCMYALTFRLALVSLSFSLLSLPCSPTTSFTVILIRVSRMKPGHFQILMNSIPTSTLPTLSSLNVCQLMALTCYWSSGECQWEENSHHLSITYNYVMLFHTAHGLLL